MKVGDEIAVEPDRHVGHVREAAPRVVRPDRRDVPGWLVDEVGEDREVVRREVPEHVHVVLEEAQVDAHGVEVVQVAELPHVDDLLHLAHGARVDESMIHHQDEAMPLGDFAELLPLRDGARQRLLHQHVLVRRKRSHRERVVAEDGCGDDDRFDLAVSEDVLRIVGDLDERVPFLRERAAVGALVRAPADLHALDLRQVAHQVRPPVTVADEADSHVGAAQSTRAQKERRSIACGRVC